MAYVERERKQRPRMWHNREKRGFRRANSNGHARWNMYVRGRQCAARPQLSAHRIFHRSSFVRTFENIYDPWLLCGISICIRPMSATTLGLALIKCNVLVFVHSSPEFHTIETFIRSNLKKMLSLIYKPSCISEIKRKRHITLITLTDWFNEDQRTRVIFNTLLVALLNYPIFITPGGAREDRRMDFN